MLKAWVDLHGLRAEHATWSAPLPGAQPFDPDRWLTPRETRDFDDEAIGLLTVPPPDLADLGADLSRLSRWLADLADDEQAVAQGRPQDRHLVLRLPGGRLTSGRRTPAGIWLDRAPTLPTAPCFVRPVEVSSPRTLMPRR